MKRVFNRNTMTVKVPSITKWSEARGENVYSEARTALRLDTLTAILVSANPLRGEYDLNESDFDKIAGARERIEAELQAIERLLNNRKKEA